MRKRLLCALLALSLLLAALPLFPALADSGWTLYAAQGQVKLYRARKLSGKALKTVYYGEAVTVTGFDNEIAEVRVGKRTGYCALDALTAGDPNTDSRKLYCQPKKAKVYAGCSTKTKKLATLKRNQSVTAVAVTPEGDWVRVKRGGKYGYMQASALDERPWEAGTAAWCCYDGTISVFGTPQSSVDVGTLRLGDAVRLLDTKDGWAKIRNDKGGIVYCDAKYITTKSPILNRTVYAQVSDKFLARKPGGEAGLKVNKKVSRNAKLTLVALGDFWARVKYRGKTYFMPALYLDETRAPRAGRAVVTLRDCELLGAPQIGGKTIAELPASAPLQLLAGGPLFAKVRTVNAVGGKVRTGWVLVSQLTGY